MKDLSGIYDSGLEGASHLVAPVLLGVLACGITVQLEDASRKGLLAVGIAGILVLIISFSRQTKEILLFAWIVSLTYDRQYFIFNRLVGRNGSQGPYVIIADIFLLSLVAVWIYEISLNKVIVKTNGNAILPWYLPFAIAAGISLFGALRTDWGAYEMIRILKVGFLFYYFRRNLNRRTWVVCLASVGFALFVQGAIATIEMITHKSGLMWLFGISTDTSALSPQFAQEQFYGWFRATATMNHPPNLACYLLLVTPPFLAVMIAARKVWMKTLCGVIGLAGITGLVGTLSRWPWVVFAMVAVIMLIGSALLRFINLRQALGLLCVVSFLGLMVLLPFRQTIYDRLTRDYSASVKLRQQSLQAALQIWQNTNPFIGAGLNNYFVYQLQYEPELRWVSNYVNVTPEDFHLRFIAAPENGFLFVLAELGILGALTFLVYVFRGFVIGVRTLAIRASLPRAACFGMVLGLFGVMMQQAIDYSYWVDPILYTYTMFVAMLSAAPVLWSETTLGKSTDNEELPA